MSSRLCSSCASYASSLGSSLGTSPALFLSLSLLFCFLLPLSPCIHDHLRRANIGAVGLGYWHRTASRTAIGSASTWQIAHERVLLHQIGRERVGDADGLFKNESDGRCRAPRDAEGRVRIK